MYLIDINTHLVNCSLEVTVSDTNDGANNGILKVSISGKEPITQIVNNVTQAPQLVLLPMPRTGMNHFCKCELLINNVVVATSNQAIIQFCN